MIGFVNELFLFFLVVGVEEILGNLIIEVFIEMDGNDVFIGGFVEERIGFDESFINDLSKSFSS